MRGLDLAEEQVGVGYRERPAVAVAERPRMRAGRTRPRRQPGAIEAQHRAATGGDRVDRHHRHAQADARDLGLGGALEPAGIEGHIGGGSPHVEADDAVEARQRRGAGGADDAAGRP